MVDFADDCNGFTFCVGQSNILNAATGFASRVHASRSVIARLSSLHDRPFQVHTVSYIFQSESDECVAVQRALD